MTSAYGPPPQGAGPTPPAARPDCPPQPARPSTAVQLLFSLTAVLLVMAGVLCVQAVLIGAEQSGKLCLTPGDDPSLGDCLLQVELKRRTSDGLLAIGIGLLSGAVTAAVAGGICLRQARSHR